jgi:hypothetical protein
MGFLTSLSKYGLIPAVTLGNLVTSGIEKVTGKTYGRTTLNEASKTTTGKVLGLATLGTGVALTSVVAGATSVGGAVRSIIPKSAVGKTLTIVGAGASISSPTVASAIIEAPLNLFAGGKKLGSAVEGLPQETKDTASKLGIAGLGIAVAGASLYGIEQVAEASGVRGGAGFIGKNPNVPASTGNEGVVASSQLTPVTRQTVDITAKRRKAKKKQVSPSMRQSVSVNIVNSPKFSQTKTYLNRQILVR